MGHFFQRCSVFLLRRRSCQVELWLGRCIELALRFCPHIFLAAPLLTSSPFLSLPPNLHNMKPTPAKAIFSYVCYGLCISARAFLLVTPAPSKGNGQLFTLLHGTYSLIGGKLPCSCPFPFQTLSQSLFFCHDVHRGS